MNCEEFDKAVGADPGTTLASVEAHAATCAPCRALRDEYRVLDERIASALRVLAPELSMPQLDNLDVDSSNVTPLPQRRRNSAPLWFGIAATLALAAWLGLALQSQDLGKVTLAEQVIEHLDHEPFSRVISNVPVSERTLDSVVSRDVAVLNKSVGLISYARSCVVNGKSVPHLVIQGENGPITVLLMPDEKVTSAIPLAGQSIHGVILPVGKGSIAIVTEQEEPLEEIEQKVVSSIKWKT